MTFNQSISQAMARTMQDLSEGVFISVAKFNLARRDSYLDYLHTGVKQDTLHCVLLPFICSHFSRTSFSLRLKRKWPEVRRRFLLASLRKPGRFHPYASNDKLSHQLDRKSSVPAWKQIREHQQSSKHRGKPSTFSQKLTKGSKPRK